MAMAILNAWQLSYSSINERFSSSVAIASYIAIATCIYPKSKYSISYNYQLQSANEPIAICIIYSYSYSYVYKATAIGSYIVIYGSRVQLAIHVGAINIIMYRYTSQKIYYKCNQLETGYICDCLCENPPCQRIFRNFTQMNVKHLQFQLSSILLHQNVAESFSY